MDSQERQIKKERMVKIKAAGAEISFNPLMMSFGIFFFQTLEISPQSNRWYYTTDWVAVHLMSELKFICKIGEACPLTSSSIRPQWLLKKQTNKHEHTFTEYCH